MLPKVVRQEVVGEVGAFIFSSVKFLQDTMYQTLLKSVEFSQLLKNKL